MARPSPGRVRPLLHAAEYRIFKTVRPRHAPRDRDFQFFEVGPWSAVDTNGDGAIDTLETRAAARRVHGLTPISEETQTIDYSWTLNVADDVKDQHTDQFTLNLEREIARNFSVGASYIYKHTTDIFANIPINGVTGQQWEYERIPFTTSAGQQVKLYSVVHKDYDGDGVVDGDDIAWIGDNTRTVVQNMPTFDGIKPKRDYHGLQFVLNKRYSDNWQALASFLYSEPSGLARRSLRQDFNAEGPMFYDDNWMGTLNQTINNLDGPLPFTPNVRVQGVWLLPHFPVDVDIGARFRTASGRPLWQLETYPLLTQFGGPAGGVVDPGGRDRGRGRKDPDHLPRSQHFSICIWRRASGSANRNGCISSSTVSTCSTPSPRPTPIRSSSSERSRRSLPRGVSASVRGTSSSAQGSSTDPKAHALRVLSSPSGSPPQAFQLPRIDDPCPYQKLDLPDVRQKVPCGAVSGTRSRFSQITVLGSCCGTDHRHIQRIAELCVGDASNLRNPVVP